MIEITFARHGETDANASGVWQGQGDAALSAIGQDQARALGERLSGRGFDLVLSSDLRRVTATAELAGFDPRPDPVWREIDIGRWEGLTRDEVLFNHPEEMEALGRGEPLPLGGGESWDQFGNRISGALEALVDSLSDGAHVLVFAHGGVIHSVVSRLLGLRRGRRPWPIDQLRNTSLTSLHLGDRGRQLATYNDSTHLGDPAQLGTDTVIALIRHGETVANTEGRWAGSTDVPLTDDGRRQARELPSRHGGVQRVYSSPLLRARETAESLATARGLPLVIRRDLVELDFGTWENLTSDEVARRYPDEWSAVYVDGLDRPRGGTGETARQAADRLGGAVAEIAEDHPGERVAVVSHGGVIRAFVGSLVGIGHADRHRLMLPLNTSVSHVRVGPSVVLVDYNLGWW